FGARVTSLTLLQEFQATSALSGGNAAYIEDLYETWLQDPSAVASAWNDYFRSLKGSATGEVAHSDAIARIEAAQRSRASRSAPVAAVNSEEAQKQAGVLKLVTAYRSRGHLAASLDPLDL